MLQDNFDNGGGDEVLQVQDMETLEVPVSGVFPSGTKARPPRKERHRPGTLDRKVA